MPRRTDIHTILIIGSGPIVIGQGCEFDYSGVQACRAIREEGYRVVLVNSNPATIMTDPEFAHATYIEPITPECVEKILENEKRKGTPIDALLPTLGGQTGLNTGMACFDKGILTKYGVQMIGANREAIWRGEDRQRFKELMAEIGLKVPRSGVVHNMDDARKVLDDIGLPLIIRPAFTLGGTGGGIAYNKEEFESIVQRGLDASPYTEVLIEQSVLGWKEYEMEVMRDKNDNVVIICSIENLDPMGVHTGDSITVAPIQTLTDKEYQRMRDASIAVIRAVGVETGGSNIQFAIDPTNGDMIVVEMNPRVSRSSALASKATGYPIAKLAAKLAIGYTLDELANDITSIRGKDGKKEATTSACFEPTIDYCVIKIPRWTFEKFPDADETLTTQMKSVGEAMAIGRTFKEALQKGIRSMEVKRFGFGLDKYDKWLNAQKSGTGYQPVKQEHGQPAHATSARDDSDKTTQGESADQEWPIPEEKLRRKLAVPSQGRLYYLRYALKMGWTIDQVYELTKIDKWFLAQMKELVDFEDQLVDSFKHGIDSGGLYPEIPGTEDVLRRAKSLGYSDIQIGNAEALAVSQYFLDPSRVPKEPRSSGIRKMREEGGIAPVYKLVDTCAAEFEAYTPYYYSTYETPYTVNGKPVNEDEIRLSDRPKVLIIGGGPNRIGQGIEFDYCCVQAAFAMKELGLESVMINSNPETVSTDYDTSDLLFFEPLTHEDVLNICERLNGGPFTEIGGRGVEILDKAVNLTTKELEGVKREVERRGFRGATVAGVMQAQESSLKQCAVLLLTRNAGPQVMITREDGTVLEVIQESKWIDDIGNEDPAFAQRVRGWLDDAPRGLVKGVIVQFGGQTPLNLAKGLKEAGVPILGTTVESIDAAGDREQFRALLQQLNLKQPANGIARNVAQARDIAKAIGYPVLVRPSFVLGGRAMEIVSDEDQLNYYMANAVEASITDAPILIDKFLDNATEVDVDCLADFSPLSDDVAAIAAAHSTILEAVGMPGKGKLIAVDAQTKAAEFFPKLIQGVQTAQDTIEEKGGRAIVIGVMEHIEEAGIHSGDSACALPPYSLSKEIVQRLKAETRALAKALRVRGLMNVQYAIKDNEIYVIEVNPRASRTVPFVSKATGIPWAKIAAKVMAGKSLAELNITEQPDPAHTSVKEVVFPFSKFPGVDVILGPEMRSTGEVMGIDANFPLAFAKSQVAAGGALPTRGRIYISVNNADKPNILDVAKSLVACGFELVATEGTFRELQKNDVPATRLAKLSEGRPNIADYIKNGQVQLIINTPTKKGPQTDEGKIRSMAVLHKVPMITTLTGARAAASAIQALQKGDWGVRPLQEYVAAQ